MREIVWVIYLKKSSGARDERGRQLIELPLVSAFFKRQLEALRDLRGA
jgi:hypothetical protein